MKNHSAFIRLLSLLLAVLTLAALPLNAFAAEETDTDTTIADMELPEPIEDGEDPFGGISLFAYNYNKIPEEMLDNSILRALAYTGYDVAYLKSIKKLYNKSYIASSLLENAPDVLSGIGYSSDGSGSGLQTVTDKSTPTGKAPDIEYFKEETGLDCADFVAYYICNYLPNIEGVDVSMLDEMKEKYGYRQDDMRFWMAGCEDLAKQGRCDAYLLASDDYENNSADYQNAIANCVPGDLIRFGTSTKDWVHYAIYAGTYDGEDYIIHVGNKRGPEISLVRYMASSSSKSSVPLAFYHFEWNDTDKYGAIEVNKKDPSGKALAGAEFTAVHKETGTKYLIGPTNASGYAKTEKVLYGEYTVTETKFPSGYQSSGTSSWNVTVNDTTPTVTINATNTLITGSIAIKKADDTGKALSGVQFGVYSNSGCTTSVGTITTNSSGVATMTGLTPGTTYYLKEKAAPTGHVYNGTVYSVKVVANTTTYANNGDPVVNTRMGKIRLIKEDKNGSLGAGYVFNIYSDEECTTKVASITTNSSGVATSGWLTPGTYYVKEAAVPSTDTDHTVSTIRYIAVVKTGEITEITVINPLKKGTVGVLKEDDKGTPMEGVMFGIYYDAECTQMAAAPFQTNAEGVGTVTVDIGSYYVQEYEALDGYIVDKTVYPVTVVADKTTYINSGEPVVNTKMGKLQIIKKDKNGILGAGYVFTVYSDVDCTKKVTTITTASNGIAVSSWLAPGIYYIRETAAPDGDNIHDLSTIRYKVTVNSGETAELTVTNPYKQGTVGVLKTDDAGTPMPNVMFAVYYDAECTQMANFPCTTDTDGVAAWKLDIGTYYVQEYSEIPGYIIDKTVYPVTVVAGKTTYVNGGDPVINVRMGKLQIIKKDKNGTLGGGFMFTIYSDAKCTQEVATVTTNTEGIATSDWLAPGTYYIRETRLPNDDVLHDLVTTTSHVTVQSGATASITFVNPYKRGSVGVLKTDDSGTPLANVQFAIYSDPECTQMANSPSFTNAEGIANWQLDIGTYYVQEYSALPGYVVDKTVYPVTVVADKTTFVNDGEPVVNVRKGQIRIVKKDKNGSLGAGYEFTIYSDEQCTIKVATATTNANGIATTDWLAPGLYYIREAKLAEGDQIHEISTIRYKVTVEPGETVTISVINPHRKGTIGVRKTDDAGTPMQGVTFAVYLDPECTQLANSPFVTNEEGIATTKVDIGDYYAREYSEIPGYVVDKTIYSVTVIADEITYINKGEPVVNIRMGWIRIIKTDPDGTLGAGYVFGIYSDADCKELLDTITTDTDGTATSDWLIPKNVYYVKELSVPEADMFHSLNETTFPVQVLPGQTTTVTVENPFSPGQITLMKKSQMDEKLSGAKFLLEWSEDGAQWEKVVYNNTDRITKGTCTSEGLTDSCLVSDSTGLITFTGLHPKLYYRITELEAPEGYLLLTDYVYTGQLPEETLKLDFTVVNATAFELPKTGTTSMTLMPIALLLCTATCVGVLIYLWKKKES